MGTLAESLGLEPIDYQSPPTEDAPILDEGDLKNIETDYRAARKNYFKILKQGMAAMDDLATVAKETKQPQAYVALTNLAKTMSDINANLLSLTERRSRVRKEGEKPRHPDTTPAPSNIGSTQDMLKRIAHGPES